MTIINNESCFKSFFLDKFVVGFQVKILLKGAEVVLH